jgi:hypothetical protein
VQLRGLIITEMETIPRLRLGAVVFRAGLLISMEVSLSRPEFDLMKVESPFRPK